MKMKLAACMLLIFTAKVEAKNTNSSRKRKLADIDSIIRLLDNLDDLDLRSLANK